ncbi:ADP-ribosyltransferase domain-containing protein [Nannocystis sp. SCPEA4]|uniref:ADP-ribosyltransferase domain-containing protein n=1 Tax=Nannocystis sp. SCPEA4 TaxID=2996787 RepID=UPI00226E85DC|nr:ADP-ribosyltransferase domain-containing protein [Nannocystis sp. SCPEA4]MCY1059375.1 ADP-ribosyltransferase domain-containing protein [Nannocystis sp. SCPEA4]
MSISKSEEDFDEGIERNWIRYLKETKNPQRYAHIPDDELLAVIRYTGSDYEELNKALRDGTADGTPWAGYARTVNAALSKLPGVPYPVIRGANLPDDVLTEYQPGNTITEKGFLSTAAASDTPVAFRTGQEYYIKSKTGVHIEDLSYISHHKLDPKKDKRPARMDRSRESEILFRAGTRFRVLAREIIPTRNPSTGQWVDKEMIYMEEV